MWLYKLIEWDKKLFLYLNQQHLEWLDPVMLTLSSFVSWISVCLLVAVFIFIKSKGKKIIAPFCMLLAIGVNSLVNNGIKLLIARPRPIHKDIWADVIHAIEDYEASYSFFSAHSSNSFCLAVFSLLYFRNTVYSYIILFWATLVAYSRIYLGKHFPLDVVCGILFGIMMGYIGYRLFQQYSSKQTLTSE